MPNHKSAEKRIRTNDKANIRNRAVRSAVKTAIKGVLASATKEDASKKLVDAIVIIDKACQKGVYHPNNAARKKSRITCFVNKLK